MVLLLWHRMYVAQFESIIQATLKDPTSALPYWDYTSDAVLPDQFRQPKDPQWAPLFNPRDLGINHPKDGNFLWKRRRDSAAVVSDVRFPLAIRYSRF